MKDGIEFLNLQFKENWNSLSPLFSYNCPIPFTALIYFNNTEQVCQMLSICEIAGIKRIHTYLKKIFFHKNFHPKCKWVSKFCILFSVILLMQQLHIFLLKIILDNK